MGKHILFEFELPSNLAGSSLGCQNALSLHQRLSPRIYELPCHPPRLAIRKCFSVPDSTRSLKIAEPQQPCSSVRERRSLVCVVMSLLSFLIASNNLVIPSTSLFARLGLIVHLPQYRQRFWACIALSGLKALRKVVLTPNSLMISILDSKVQ